MSKQKTKTTAGLEIIGDMKECDSAKLNELTAEIIKPLISTLLKDCGLRELGSHYHQFDKGCTGVVALAESHLAFHTWPEERYVSVDIFVCNYRKDNSKKAEEIFKELARLFCSKNPVEHRVIRNFH